jgi:hypothetical protein
MLDADAAGLSKSAIPADTCFIVAESSPKFPLSTGGAQDLVFDLDLAPIA